MKKVFKSYVLIWAILLVIYNAVVFAARPILPGYVIRYDARFWISWGVILAAFVGQLLCAKKAFDSENKEKLFLNLPLITLSYGAMIAIMVVGSVLMLIPDFPAWITIIVCALILGFNAIAVIKADLAASVISGTEDKIKVQTSFIKMLIVDADSLMARAKSEAAKVATKKVYEAARYSDPMSNGVLSGVESEIGVKFNQFAAEVNADSEYVSTVADELVALIGDRNKRCKLLK